MSASPNDGLPSAPPIQATEPGPKPQPPGTINASFWLYIAGTVVGIIGTIFVASDKQRIIDSIQKSNHQLSGSQLNTAANVALVLAVVFAVVWTVLYLLFAVKLRAGRNWARIVLTILFVLNVLSLVANQGTQGVEYIGTVLLAAATVLAYLPASNAYFASCKTPR
jgi:hypothetical protein